MLSSNPPRPPLDACYDIVTSLGPPGSGGKHIALDRQGLDVGRLVVIERLRDPSLSDPKFQASFQAEGRVIGSVHHAYVVPTQQISRDDESFYRVIEYVEGLSLGAMMDRALNAGDAVPSPVVSRILLDVLGGLGAVHDETRARSGFALHGGLTLSSIIVGTDGIARLGALNLLARAHRALLHPNPAPDTPRILRVSFVPPEAATKQGLDGRADIYALGVIGWSAYAGAEPWAGSTDSDVLDRLLHQGVPDVRLLLPDLGDDLAAVIMRACHPVPDQRFATAGDMLAALTAAANAADGIATSSEVAALVATLAGDDFSVRRRLVVQTRENRRSRSNAPVPHLTPAPQPVRARMPAAPVIAAGQAETIRAPSERGSLPDLRGPLAELRASQADLAAQLEARGSQPPTSSNPSIASDTPVRLPTSRAPAIAAIALVIIAIASVGAVFAFSHNDPPAAPVAAASAPKSPPSASAASTPTAPVSVAPIVTIASATPATTTTTRVKGPATPATTPTATPPATTAPAKLPGGPVAPSNVDPSNPYR